MDRFIQHELRLWKDKKKRKPLLIRGARQVGKTHAVRELGTSFEHFAEINLEYLPQAKNIFESDLDPERIIRELSILTQTRIIPGKTLLFLDEAQSAPRSITALRYFYEKLPELHILAAGSLLDFAIEDVGIPVGRVESLYMYPISFFEFLIAYGEKMLAKELILHETSKPLATSIHEKLLHRLAEYLLIGGMPEVVQSYVIEKDPLRCFQVQNALLDTYAQDFHKYARKKQIKYLELIFNTVPRLLGKRFKYSEIHGEYRKRELAPAVDLLVTAGIIHRVYHSDGQGVPLMAQIDPDCFKLLFLDIGLVQAALGNDISSWLLSPEMAFINKGEIVEAFVGQELLAYSSPHAKNNINYWQRHAPSSSAEVDYLIVRDQKVIPLEVKSGSGNTLRSLHLFLQTHRDSTIGLRFSTRNFNEDSIIKSLPLYAVASLTSDKTILLRMCD